MDADRDDHLRRALVHGLQPVVPEIVPPDPDWPDRFVAHRDRLAAVLGPRARTVEHIGSTAVPGLAAKDVVDILVVVDDPDDEQAYLPDLVGAGYDLRVVESGHRCLRGEQEPGGAANVHCYAADTEEVARYRLLREHLRADVDARRTYEDAKRALAGRRWPDMNHYADAKSPVIHRLLRDAGWTGPL